ncbi:MAG TPA: TrkH family potassium uptake protein [Magnetospirillaceae bacterium]
MLLDLRPVLVVNGYVLLILAATMGVPLVVDLAVEGTEWSAFILAIAVSGFVGLGMVLSARRPGPFRLGTREAFLSTASAWLLGGVVSALPFCTGPMHLSVTDALFEAVSGLTTTGATVMRDLDHAPASLLLWRALLNWIGGIGIILTAVAVLPFLRIGGMQLFRLDSSESGDASIPRLSKLAWSLLAGYSLFTFILAIAFMIAGMNLLEAVCHAMSTISTGGFSTSDRSLGHFSEAARWIAVIGMVAGGTSFTLFLEPWRRGPAALFGDSQVRRYLMIIVIMSLLLTVWNWSSGHMALGEALERSIFNATSVLTTSGFHWGDYDSWGGFAQVAFFIMAFIGGCSGSAAGGIKVFRLEVLFAAAGIHLRRLLHPHGVFAIELNERRISEPVVRSVLGFVMLYLICVALLALALALTGLDAGTSLSGAASALGNIGPGLGPIIGPAGSYQDVPQAAKWILTAGMLLGRLEVATVIAVFSRAFWRS